MGAQKSYELMTSSLTGTTREMTSEYRWIRQGWRARKYACDKLMTMCLDKNNQRDDKHDCAGRPDSLDYLVADM